MTTSRPSTTALRRRRRLSRLVLAVILVVLPALALGAPPTAPSITGEAVVGATLTAEVDPAVSELLPTFEWYRENGLGEQALIGEQAGATYVVDALDVDHRLVVRVVVAGEASEPSQPTAVVTDPTDPPPPVTERPRNESPPTVAGEAKVLGILVGSPGVWTGSPEPTLRHEWLRCLADACSPIAGADGLSYELGQADEGRTLRLREVATNTVDSATAESVDTDVVAPAFVNRTRPTIAVTGAVRAGSSLRAGAGTWYYEALPGDGISYQWRRCDADGSPCRDIDRAVRATYTASEGDVGQTIRVRVSVSSPEDPSVRPGEADSSATAVVEAAPQPPPTAETGATTAVSATTATLLGQARLGEADASWWFEYGVGDGYGFRTPAVVAGSEAVRPVQADVSGLAPGTVYHYRVVAANSAGVTVGDDATFTTAAAIVPDRVVPLATTPTPDAASPVPPSPPPVVSAPPPPGQPVASPVLAPLATVGGFSVRVDVNVVRLSWLAPAASPRPGVVIVRRAGRKPRNIRDGTIVYRGRAGRTDDVPTGLSRVWYAAFVVTGPGRFSAPAYATIRSFRPVLLRPVQASTVGRRVTFAWKPVRGARYYNVQVWDGQVRRRITTRWPAGRTLRVQLRPGRYRWYVYPGFGSQARPRYGALHGQGSFRVR